MIEMHAVKQSHRVGDDCGFGGFAGATAVSAVVHCIERSLRKCIGQRRQTARDILGVAAKVDHGVWTGMGAGADEYPFTVDIKNERGTVVAGQFGLWIIDE